MDKIEIAKDIIANGTCIGRKGFECVECPLYTIGNKKCMGFGCFDSFENTWDNPKINWFKDWLKENDVGQEETFEYGEEVEVADHDLLWTKMVFIADTGKESGYRYIAMKQQTLDALGRTGLCTLPVWKHCRKVQPVPKLTKRQLEDIIGYKFEIITE